MWTVLLLLAFIPYGSSVCYFPAAFQGEYVTQKSAVNVSYSNLVILSDSIPVWGVCHTRIGNNVVLEDSTGGLKCYKCFNLVLRSSNVIQVFTRNLNKCYVTEQRAMENCPTEMNLQNNDAIDIILYRTKGFMGEPAVSPTYCPINGAYQFTYAEKNGDQFYSDCESGASEISDCPYGFGLNLKFQDCSFGSLDMSFHCLGDWSGKDGERYLALMDTQAQQTAETPRPRYRCGLYREDPTTGRIDLALSADSTCTNGLESSRIGHEHLELTPIDRHIPFPEDDVCDLPEWFQGKWENIHVIGNTIVLKDQRNFKTYTAKCVSYRQHYNAERFLLHAQTHCGDEHFKCVWIKDRGHNAMEFQLGLYTSAVRNDSLCSEDNFQERTWTTQGRLEVTDPTPYPIIGEYTGVIPDTDGLCAKLYSDCNNPEIMFYTIFNCFNRSEIFEEREYRCLGEWREDGLIYTYTERRDMIGYECFVGLVTAKNDIYLREAGINCERGQEPLKYGMKLSQVSKCFGSSKWRKQRPTMKPWTRVKKSGAPMIEVSGWLLLLAISCWFLD